MPFWPASVYSVFWLSSTGRFALSALAVPAMSQAPVSLLPKQLHFDFTLMWRCARGNFGPWKFWCDYQPSLPFSQFLFVSFDWLVRRFARQACFAYAGRVSNGTPPHPCLRTVVDISFTQHRDLKLANCMFEDNSPAPIVKVIDFGLCTELKDGQTSSAFVGTMTYAAPEVRASAVGARRVCRFERWRR